MQWSAIFLECSCGFEIIEQKEAYIQELLGCAYTY